MNKKSINAVIKRCFYIKNDIYKNGLRTRIYLYIFSLKIPLLLKRCKSKNRVEYRLFFLLPILYKKDGNQEKINFIHQTQENYKNIIQRIQFAVKENKPIRVGFFIVFDSVFSARAIFEQMLKDTYFAPFVVVIPDTLRGEERMFSEMVKTYKSLCESYPQHTDKILHSYDEDKRDFINYSSTLDIVYFDNPYDGMTHQFYTIFYLSQFALSVYMPYGYTGYLNYTLGVYATLEYSLLWRIYVENQNNYELISSHQMAKIENLKIVGYPKLDTLAKFLTQGQESNKERKQIIIAPHHTLTLEDFPLYISNFIRLSEFFLKLPKLYPQIDFIFRPHPLLFTHLVRLEICERSVGMVERVELGVWGGGGI